MKKRLAFSIALALRFVLVFSLLASEAVSPPSAASATAGFHQERLALANWPATVGNRHAEPWGPGANPVVSPGSELLIPRPQKTLRRSIWNDKGSLSLAGQSATLLPDGRWLLIGGEGPDGPVSTAAVRDARTGAVTSLPNGLSHPRAWHTATLLPDGSVLVLGGIGADGKVLDVAELFDPGTQGFENLAATGLTPRAYHSATLLTEGRVLVAGGLSPTGETLGSIELWDPKTRSIAASPSELLTPRRKHTATLLRDGTALFWGGADRNEARLDYGEVYDPATQGLRMQTSQAKTSADPPRLEASLPEDRAENVPLDVVIALRFSKPLRVGTVNANSVTLRDAEGAVAAKVIPAEAGMLAFLTPKGPLFPGTTYTLTLTGLSDAAGLALPDASVTFTTAGRRAPDEVWAPGAGGWTTGLPDSPWQKLPPLQAPREVTALAGQVLKLNGEPLAHVTLQIGGNSARTDHTGRFLLGPLTAGHHVMLIDGRTASRPGRTYGVFEVGVDVAAGRTNALSYTIWMPLIDMAHAVTIPSATLGEVVVTTPLIPGLELRIPPQTVIRDHEGQVVTQLSITPVPLDRPPFPLAAGVDVPIYFTIQPGAAYLRVSGEAGPQGARLIYPNLRNARPAARFDFWNYDPGERGWYVYGQGTVTPEGRQIVPEPGVVIYEFTGAMVAPPTLAPPNGPPPGGKKGGDPVDLATGLFVLESTDLFLPDILPINLTRTYRQGDSRSRAFGIGTTHPYDIFLAGTTCSLIDLILPDGGRIHYPKISGTDFTNCVYQHTSSPTAFYGSTITWNGNGWNLKLKDGTLYVFPEAAGVDRPQKAALLRISDRYGNTLSIGRDSTYKNITQVTSPNGRWISFTYDSSDPDHNRVQTITDNIGRQINYGYDTAGRLSTVRDANGGITTYTYYPAPNSDKMQTIKDPRQIVYLTNVYDSNGRVQTQTQADQTTYQFAYTLDANGKVIQTDVTDPRSNVRRVTFNSNGYALTETLAVGQLEQQVLTYDRDPVTNLVNSVTDPMGFKTSYTYDAMGNAKTVTTLDGTSAAATTTYTYDPVFNQVASITDPLQHRTTFLYYPNGSLQSVTDPLQNATTFVNNFAGQPISITDPLQNPPTQLSYEGGDLASVTDPLNRTTTFFTDAAGRRVAVTNPLNQTTRYQYDPLDEMIQITDPLGGVTKFDYDPNGNLLTVTDAVQNQMPLPKKTVYTYENMDRLETRTDQLGNVETYHYDPAGNVRQLTDRRGKITTFGYDALNRRNFAGFGTIPGPPPTYESTVNYSYDGLDRLTQAIDSLAGNITRQYDDVNRTFTETTPQGSVTYVLDAAGRRASMTVAGQPAVTYLYDEANRLKQITQGTSIVRLDYDNDSRRQTLTLPNGVVITYGYDSASQLASITYKLGTTTLGGLTYGYDLAGERTSMGGSFARTGLPQPVSATAYNAANQLTQWGTATLTYDLNGNLAGDGVNTYEWDARNQLATINSGVTGNFQYDASGRRTSKTVGGAATAFLYDNLNVVQELSGSPLAPSANLLTGLEVDEVLTRTDANGAANFLADALGSTFGLTDSFGTILTQYTYEPFGNTTVSGQASANAFQYTGRENDGTGLYFYRARYYSPTVERFVSEDTLDCERRTGMNLYAYVSNNPLNLTDPSGLSGVGPDACKYYDDLCKKSSAKGPKDKYACKAGQCCREFGDAPKPNCVRECLIEQDKECVQNSPNSLPSCRFRAHVRCYTKCRFVPPRVPASCRAIALGF